MKGINQFSASHLLEKQASATTTNCVFVSYSRKDKDEANGAVRSIRNLGIDVYFDEDDVALQLADKMQEHEKVVECIENGLDHATSLLGIITENTKESWWVPYEIGSAKGRGKLHAHLITGEVEYLPSYIQASTLLPSLQALEKWLFGHLKSRMSRIEIIVERVKQVGVANEKSAGFVKLPLERPISDLKFY